MKKIEEAVEEPPAKTSKIVEEALKNFKYGYHKIRKIVLRKQLRNHQQKDLKLLRKDVEINWLRKQIKDYARERREMMKYINYIETLLHVSCTPHSKANQSWIN